MKQILLIAAILILFTACKRRGEPYAKICTNLSNDEIENVVTIKLADTLTLINCSKRYTKQRWVMPNGGTSSNETVYFIPPASLDTFVVHLYVSDDDFVSEYEATKRIAVIP